MLHVSSNIISCDYRVACVYLFQLASLPGVHVTHIPKGNLDHFQLASLPGVHVTHIPKGNLVDFYVCRIQLTTTTTNCDRRYVRTSVLQQLLSHSPWQVWRALSTLGLRLTSIFHHNAASNIWAPRESATGDRPGRRQIPLIHPIIQGNPISWIVGMSRQRLHGNYESD